MFYIGYEEMLIICQLMLVRVIIIATVCIDDEC